MPRTAGGCGLAWCAAAHAIAGDDGVRMHSVRGAFALRRRSVKGRQLVLIDDLLSTGATNEQFEQGCAAPAWLIS